MSTGNWFSTHRKHIITHTSIVVAFALFTAFGAEPLFDTLERMPGEAQLQQLQLPAETDNVVYGFASISTYEDTGVEMWGWAFVEGQDCKNRELYIVLKSAHRTYVFDSQVMPMRDLAAAFGELCLNPAYSGFTTIIPTRKISNGDYSVGIYVREGGLEGLQYTDRAIAKSGGITKLPDRSSS